MQDIKVGDVITFTGDDENNTVLREEVMGRIDQVVFTRSLLDKGATSSLHTPDLIEDLIAYGWELEEKEVDMTDFSNFLGDDPTKSLDKLTIRRTD